MAVAKGKTKSLDEELQTPETRAQIEKFLREHSIECLDDVVYKNTNECHSDFWHKIGIPPKVGNVKKILIELKFFSPQIKEHRAEIRKKIARRILETQGGIDSYYLDNSLDQEIWLSNVQFIFEELKVIEEERGNKIEHLNNFTNKNSGDKYMRFWKSIGVKKSGKTYSRENVQNRLVELGLFNPIINSYPEEIKNNIIESILDKHYGAYSFYLNEQVGCEVWTKNIKTVFEELKKRKALQHLYDIDAGKHEGTEDMRAKYHALWQVIKVKKVGKKFNTQDIRKRLIEIGIFSPKISDYEGGIKKEIINGLLSNFSRYHHYLNNSLNEDVWIDNVRLIFEELKRIERIEHLDDIRKVVVATRYSGFWEGIGVKRERFKFNVEDAQNRLTELGLFSFRINDYNDDTKKKIIRGLLDQSQHIKPYYLNKSIDEEIWEGNVKSAFGELKKREGIEHLDNIDSKLAKNYHGFWSSIGVKRSGKTNHNLEDIKKKLIDLELISPKISDYGENAIKKIIEKIIRPKHNYSSGFFYDILDKEIREENVKIVFGELKKREGIEHLDDLRKTITRRYWGFWDTIGVRLTKVALRPNDVKIYFIHTGYFHEDVEQKYGRIRHKGTAVELLKMLDRELFDYKDLEVDESKVDTISFEVLKKLNKEAQALPQKQRPRNSLDLFEYYQKEYEHGRS